MVEDGVIWQASISPPRSGKREKSLYIRSWLCRDGVVVQDERISARTTDPALAEERRLERLRELNYGERLTLPRVMDARIEDLERDPGKGEETPEGFRSARKAIAKFLDVALVDLPTLTRARDLMRDDGLGPETINTYLRRAAASWRWAQQRSMVATSWPPLRALKKPPRKKQPFTPAQVDAVLAWSLTYMAGRWAGPLHLIAETGRRVSEVCRLKGCDLDRAERTVRVIQKGARVLVLPVSDEVLALLPDREADEWLFPASRERRLGSGRVPIRRGGVLGAVRQAIKVLGFPNGGRLDLHSFRRSISAHGERAGVPDGVLMQLTGHETPSMLAHYRRDTVGDDARGALDKIRAYRAAQAAPQEPPKPPKVEAPEQVSENDRSRDQVAASDGAMRIRISDLVLIRDAANSSQTTPRHEDHGPAACGAAMTSDAFFWRALQEGIVRRVAAWADEDIEAMRTLLGNVELQAQFRAAIERVAPRPAVAPERYKNGTAPG